MMRLLEKDVISVSEKKHPKKEILALKAIFGLGLPDTIRKLRV
jgi:hypothetical protein